MIKNPNCTRKQTAIIQGKCEIILKDPMKDDTGLTMQMVIPLKDHCIIHDTNPMFDRRRLIYIYKNGLEQKLVRNQHL